MLPGVDERRDGAGLRDRGNVERAAFGSDLELLLEVADGLDLDVVVGVCVDQLVEDLLVRGGLLGLARAHQVDLAGVLR